MTQIFLDSGDFTALERVLDAGITIHGQTTNPSLVIKSETAQARIAKGEKFSAQEILDVYKNQVKEVRSLLPHGSVSIEVIATEESSGEDLLEQAKSMHSWITDPHIKFPLTKAGLEAGKQWIAGGGKANFTLVFSQEQAYAVAEIAKESHPGQVFISPFIGRLLDIGENGFDLIRNIQKMYAAIFSPVKVLAASVRTQEQFQLCKEIGTDIITVPEKVLLAKHTDTFNESGLKKISYIHPSDLATSHSIKHPLTDKGLAAFTSDWEGAIN